MTALLVAAVVVALAAGPVLARVGVRVAAGYRTPGTGEPPPHPGAGRVATVTAVLAVLLVGAVLLLGARPFLLALAWAAGASVVLAQVDLAVHRLPDRVVLPSIAVVAAAALVDALVLGSWDELLRALLAGAAAFTAAAAVGFISPRGLGFGDVKLLGLLGVLLGWFGWPVLLLGVLLGFAVGALVSLGLLAARRAGWRTEIAFGPSLLAGAALALAMPAILGA
jgi:leader peptidase (prepilin peptidase) / N-methyltransferase